MFWRRLILLALLLLPVVFIAQVGSVTIHEFLGHGCTALLLGGHFYGFILQWDGMGWAFVSPAFGAPRWHAILIFAGGACVTILIGLAFLGVARIARRSIALRLTFLLFSLFCLLDNASYFFFNAYRPVPPGDIGQILALLAAGGSAHISLWRWSFMLAGGIISLAATVGILALFFQSIEMSLNQGPLPRAKRAFVLTILIAVPGCLSWLLFDWNQAIPGIGQFPQYAGAASIVLTALGLYCFSLNPTPTAPFRNVTWRHALVAWLFAGATFAVTFFWLSKGVFWKS